MTPPVDHEAFRRHVERSVNDLPAMPTVVSKVIEIADSLDGSAQDVQKIIATDQALTGKVLRVVNSAYYGAAGQISSITQGVMVLGMRQLRNLTLSLAAMSLVKSRAAHMVEHQAAFWRHSFAVGSASMMVGKQARLPQSRLDDVFTGGLLHDLGRLFLLSFFYDLFFATLQMAEERGCTTEQAEKALLGLDHTEIGAMLAAHWKFPEGLLQIIRYHHGPMPQGDYFASVACVHLAEALTDEASEGKAFAEIAILDEVRSWAKLTEDEFTFIQVTVSQQISEAEDMIGLMHAA